MKIHHFYIGVILIIIGIMLIYDDLKFHILDNSVKEMLLMK